MKLFPNLDLKIQGSYSCEIHYYVDCWGVVLYRNEFNRICTGYGRTIAQALCKLDVKVTDPKTSPGKAATFEPNFFELLDQNVQLHEMILITPGYSASYRIADGTKEVFNIIQPSIGEALVALQFAMRHYRRP